MLDKPHLSTSHLPEAAEVVVAVGQGQLIDRAVSATPPHYGWDVRIARHGTIEQGAAGARPVAVGAAGQPTQRV